MHLGVDNMQSSDGWSDPKRKSLSWFPVQVSRWCFARKFGWSAVVWSRGIHHNVLFIVKWFQFLIFFFWSQCLAAGSSILNRETESAVMRPLAKALAKSLEAVREQLREQCLRNTMDFSDKLKESLGLFDRLFAEFELSYVSAMVPVKSALEYNHQQDIIVLFSETLQRALSLGLLAQDLVDTCDPALMFTIPRLAIVCGLLILPEGPLNLQRQLSELFRPFRNLLCKIRDLLWTLTSQELQLLEKALCSTDPTPTNSKYPICKTDEYITKFHQDFSPTQKYYIKELLFSSYFQFNFLFCTSEPLESSRILKLQLIVEVPKKMSLLVRLMKTET